MHMDAIEDSDQAINRLARDLAKHTAAEAMYTEIITDLFTKTICLLPHIALSIPCVTGNKIMTTPVADVVSDECSYGKPLEALMQALKLSDCPHVAELRKAIAARYIDANVSWIAEVAT